MTSVIRLIISPNTMKICTYIGAPGIKYFHLSFIPYGKLVLNVFIQKSSLPNLDLQLQYHFIMTITRKNPNYLDAARFTFAKRIKMFVYVDNLFYHIYVGSYEYVIHSLLSLHTVYHNLHQLEEKLSYLYVS